MARLAKDLVEVAWFIYMIFTYFQRVRFLHSTTVP